MGKKVKIGVLPNVPYLSMTDSIIMLRKIMDEIGVKIKVMYIDQKFYKYSVMGYLKSIEIQFIHIKV